jgi:hypothetical protein
MSVPEPKAAFGRVPCQVAKVPLADIVPTGRGIALERGYLCRNAPFIAVAACEE